ncbi:MAG: hypothetical protein OXM87_11835 [Truepera sp.]|nr:hypothetical protein [Truepera sp.]
MATDDSDLRRHVRYQPDEKPPTVIAMGLGLQLAILSISGIVLTPAIVIRAASGTESYISWAVFAAVAISGLTTILQAVRVGRVGAGYVLLMGTSGAFIAVCVTALVEGGPAMLATLVAISSLFQFSLAGRLSLFRRILTPTVAGTAVMLIPVTVMPIIFDMLKVPSEVAPAPAAPLSALATLLVSVVIALKATGSLRLWAPVIGVAVGSAVAGLFGLYDIGLITEASWIGLPAGEWPGFDLDFGPAFWALLPAFVFVTLIGAIETIGDSVAIQRVSWRRPRAVDFRSVQGAVAADGVGNLLSGLAGTVPNTTYSSSIAVTELTGVAARSVGIVIGLVFIALAFLPKALAVVLAIPGPVVAAYATVLMAMLFMVGLKIVVQDGSDYRKGLISGVAFWIGVGFQNGVIFPDYFSGLVGGLLQNGMTAGGLAAIFMTLFVELTEPRRSRTKVEFALSALPKIREFLGEFSSRCSWDEEMASRLDAVGEETLLTLLEKHEARAEHDHRQLLLTAHKEDGGAVLEFIASTSEDNLQDRIALLGEQTAGVLVEREVSLRLLRHFASSVLHQQYHGLDIVTVRVDAPERLQRTMDRSR